VENVREKNVSGELSEMLVVQGLVVFILAAPPPKKLSILDSVITTY